MSEHYYTRNPVTESDPVYWDTYLRNQPFRFKADQGVFSKKSVDFGSRLLIDTIEIPDQLGPLLDVGCGYGPIGLAMAKEFPDRPVHMVDVNLRALDLAKTNAVINNIDNVLIYESDGFEAVKEKEFIAIFTNPPIRAGKKVVYRIFEDSYHHLRMGGELWVVIQKKQGAPSAKVKLEEIFEEVEIVTKKKGYYIFKAKKS